MIEVQLDRQVQQDLEEPLVQEVQQVHKVWLASKVQPDRLAPLVHQELMAPTVQLGQLVQRV
jgi:hypothetical protein